MNKIFVFVCAFLWPLSLLAMTPVSDFTLSDVTGQAGVNINADLTMNIGIGTLAWGDSDGIQGFNSSNGRISPWTTIGTGGYVGVTGFNISTLRIKARETDAYEGYSTSTSLKPITIDVATGTKLGVANTSFVRFGLGSLEVDMDAMSFNIEMGPNHNLGQVLGTVYVGPMNTYINPNSYIDIYSHAGCGVNLEFNVNVDKMRLGYLFWGDTDGLPGGNPGNAGGVGNWIGSTNTGGYIGLANVEVDGISVAGTVSMDVVSIAAGQGVYAGQNMSPYLDNVPITVVHFSWPTTSSICVRQISAEVVAMNNWIEERKKAFCNYYASNIIIQVHPGGWVDIWTPSAH